MRLTRKSIYPKSSTRSDFDLPLDGASSTVYYNHGLNPALKARPLGRATLQLDEAGVWMEAELQARDAYEAKILEMVRAGKLGLSSGTASHLVERSATKNLSGETVHHIDRWPLGLDASLTPTPGEPRTLAVSLKTLVERDELDGLGALESALEACRACEVWDRGALGFKANLEAATLRYVEVCLGI